VTKKKQEDKVTDKKTEEKTKTGLTNREIWKAYPQLVELSRVKLPIRPSLGVAKIINVLEKPYTILDKERLKILGEYAKVDKKTQQKTLTPNDPGYSTFIEKLDELFDIEWDKEIKIEKIKIPEKIAGTCEACHNNMDVEFLIEASILVPLQEKFVEVI